jgi:hypothetical protein
MKPKDPSSTINQDFGKKFKNAEVEYDPLGGIPKFKLDIPKNPKAFFESKTYEADVNLQGTSANRKFSICTKNWGQYDMSGGTIGARPQQDYDRMMELARKYWTMNSELDSPNFVFRNKSNKANYQLGVPFDITYGEPHISNVASPIGLPENTNIYFEIWQTVSLYPDASQIYDVIGEIPGAANEMIEQKQYSPQKWKQLLVGDETSPDPGQFGVLFENLNYEYMAFMSTIPYGKAQNNNSGLPNQSYITTEPEYNYTISSYEAVTANPVLPERLLPNLYSLQMVSDSDDISKLHGHIKNHVTLNGKLEVQGGWNSMRYYDKYSKIMQQLVTSQDSMLELADVMHKFRNIIIPSSEIKNLKMMAEQKELFPIHATIDISTEKTSAFTDILQEVGLLDKFILELVKSDIINMFTEKRFYEINELLHVGEGPTGEVLTKKIFQESLKDNRLWDITKLLERISLVNFTSGELEVGETLDQHLEAVKSLIVMDSSGAIESQEATPPENKFYSNLMALIAAQKLKEFFKTRIRTYEDLLAGRLNYSETVLYRIEKFPSEEGLISGKRIQNIWIPNISEQDLVTYVDTQLKYGEEYTYKVYSYQMVLGSVYKYLNSSINGEHTKSGYDPKQPAMFDVLLTPKISLVEQEIHRHVFTVMDSPPPPPQADIIPYKNRPDAVLINLTPSVDDYMDFPIIVEDRDEEKFKEIRKAQKKGPSEKIRFNSDDSIGKNGYYEIYYTSQRPRTYEDFRRQLKARASSNSIWGSSVESTSASARLTLPMNQKQYFMFRMVDQHFNVSNPTAVYEVELVEHNGSHYFTKKVVEMAPPEPRLPSKPCRRLIEIKPALDQTFINLESLGDLNSAFDVKNVKLGSDNSPWGKRYKIRFVSKKTGKKIDLNLRCKIKLEKGNPNNE